MEKERRCREKYLHRMYMYMYKYDALLCEYSIQCIKMFGANVAFG